jgi:DNA polymerase-1
VTWRLHKVLKPRLAEEHGTRVYERVDRPLIPVVAQMERHGIKVDRQALAGLSEEFAKETARIEREIWDCCGVEFTIGSPRSSARCCSTSWATRAGARARAGSTRPTRRSSKASPTRARRWPGWCSNGAS